MPKKTPGKKKTTKDVRYPDISDLLAQKASARKARAKLSFGEKIERMERLRENLAPFKALREARKARG
jgi:hypothetical protein